MRVCEQKGLILRREKYLPGVPLGSLRILGKEHLNVMKKFTVIRDFKYPENQVIF